MTIWETSDVVLPYFLLLTKIIFSQVLWSRFVLPGRLFNHTKCYSTYILLATVVVRSVSYDLRSRGHQSISHLLLIKKSFIRHVLMRLFLFPRLLWFCDGSYFLLGVKRVRNELVRDNALLECFWWIFLI